VFNKLRDDGKTILFVTHDMASVKRFCHRALLLDRGEVISLGEPDFVGNNYMELNFGREALTEGEPQRYGDGTVDIAEAWFEGESGERLTSIEAGQPCTFRARIVFNGRTERAAAAVVFEDEQHQSLFAAASEGSDSPVFEAGDESIFTVRFENVFAPGRLHASPWLVSDSGRLRDRRPRFTSVVVRSMHATGGIVDLPHEVSLEPARGRTPTSPV
jgi:hypothetical protein